MAIDFPAWMRYYTTRKLHAYLPPKEGRGCRMASQADVAERYTRLSQKQVPQGLRVRISPSAPI